MMKPLLRSGLLAIGLCVAPSLGAAHPHVFIETALRAVVDDSGTFKGVEITWTYDDFYSLLLFADMGLDNDADGRLRPDEIKQLEGFDLNWVDGYEGDSYAAQGGTAVALGAPEARGLSVEGGRIISTHFRAADAPAEGLALKIYDPTFYTAYELKGLVEVDGPCTASVEPANLDEAYSRVEELLYATRASQAADEFPQVGDRFADTVTLLCQP